MSTIEAGKNPRDIILKPVTTEKSLALMDLGKYTFEVDPRANKTEIKIALERIFGVKIGSIATQNRKGKTVASRLSLTLSRSPATPPRSRCCARCTRPVAVTTTAA